MTDKTIEKETTGTEAEAEVKTAWTDKHQQEYNRIMKKCCADFQYEISMSDLMTNIPINYIFLFLRGESDGVRMDVANTIERDQFIYILETILERAKKREFLKR